MGSSERLCLGLGLIPYVYPVARTELSRTTVLPSALKEGRDVPPVVILGDSAVMAGVDARQCSSSAGGAAWNLGSTGQELSETLLLVDAVPRSVNTVIALDDEDAGPA